MEKNKVYEEENIETVDQELNDVQQDQEQPRKRKYGVGETVVYYGRKGLRAVGRAIKKAAPIAVGIAIGAGGALGICTALAGRKDYIDYNNDLPDDNTIDGEAVAIENVED